MGYFITGFDFFIKFGGLMPHNVNFLSYMISGKVLHLELSKLKPGLYGLLYYRIGFFFTSLGPIWALLAQKRANPFMCKDLGLYLGSTGCR